MIKLLEAELIVILSNTLISLGVFIATLVRIRIEHEQVSTFKKNVDAEIRLRRLCDFVRQERKELVNLSREELEDFLSYLERLGEE